MFGYTSCPSYGLQNGLSMYVAPSGSVVCVLWHMCGSFVLLRGLDAVVATEAAEETDEAFTVPLEAAVAFVLGPVAAVGAGAVGASLIAWPEVSDLSGCSAEWSSEK